MPEDNAFAALQAENARLVALLESHGIEWRTPPFSDARPVSVEPAPEELPGLQRSGLSAADKLALFRRLFRGRTDVYPVRWESRTSGKSGYAPACANEWRAGVCEKPRIKCGDCSQRLLIPLSDAVIYDHLHASCWPQGNWSVKVSITRRWIPWCWPCRSPGRARCSNTLAACIENMPARPMYGSLTLLIPGIQRCCACGTSASVVTGLGGIDWAWIRDAVTVCCGSMDRPGSRTDRPALAPGALRPWQSDNTFKRACIVL
jgi:hypothetical protein